MALAFHNIENKPQTHIIIIGVGNYPYLKGGNYPKRQEVIGLQDLGQLTSPPESAMALYKLFIELDQQGFLLEPLGSIELLISAWSGFAFPPEISCELATKHNIEAAYDRWWQRCNTHRENTAIFFFCGHGLEKGDQYLLAQDFGENPRNPWGEAFAFDVTRSAFHRCRAQTQLFFVDACRQVTAGMLEADLSRVPGLDTSTFIGTECIHNLTIKAAALNRSAYGEMDQPSYFTKALIKGLNGQAATTNENDDWVIETGNLALLMKDLIRNEKEDQGNPQRCPFAIGESREIIRLGSIPEVMLQVSCNPDEALGFADLYCVEPISQTKQQRGPAQTPWELPLKAGIYELQANFAGMQYTNSRKMTTVTPPFKKEKIKCQ